MRPIGTSLRCAALLLACLVLADRGHAAASCIDAGGKVFRAAADPGYVLADVRCERLAVQPRADERPAGGAVVLGASGVRDLGADDAGRGNDLLPPAVPPTHRTRQRAAAVLPHIESAARTWGHDPALLHALVSVESGYAPDAVSPKGAVGLMQVMPETARRYGVADPRSQLLDPRTNVELGAKHLASLKRAFDGDLRLALAGYNAGEQSVINNGRRVPPFPETRAYVRDVIDRYLTFKQCVNVIDCVR
jgi:hypothetical protein